MMVSTLSHVAVPGRARQTIVGRVHPLLMDPRANSGYSLYATSNKRAAAMELNSGREDLSSKHDI